MRYQDSFGLLSDIFPSALTQKPLCLLDFERTVATILPYFRDETERRSLTSLFLNFALQLLRETGQRDRRDGWRAACGGWPEQRAVRRAGKTAPAEGPEEQCDSAEQYPGETVGCGQHRFRGQRRESAARLAKA